MPETVLVTIKWDGAEADFELPTQKPFGMWADSLKLALKNSFYGIRLEGAEFMLFWNGICIPKDAVLSECGIFDGAILELRFIYGGALWQ